MISSPYDNLPVGKSEKTLPEYVSVSLPEENSPVTQKETLSSETADSAAPAYNKPATPAEPANHTSDPVKSATPEISKAPPVKTVPADCKIHCDHLSIKNRCESSDFILPFEDSLLVPDTMPDMAEILFAEASVTLSQPGKLSYSSKESLSGTVTLYTVYRPDSAQPAPVDVVKSAIPFKTDKCWRGVCGDVFHISVKIESVHSQMINERKFAVKGQLRIKIEGITSCSLDVFKGSDDENLISRREYTRASSLVHEAEDTTEISQEIPVKDELPSPRKILMSSCNIIETHRQFASEKLVVSGVVDYRILYNGEDEENSIPCSIAGKIDFTQFISAGDIKDAESVSIVFSPEEFSIRVSDSADGFYLEGRLHTLVYVYENRIIPMTSDAYHKKRELFFDTSSSPLTYTADMIQGEISAREVINTEHSGRKATRLIAACTPAVILQSHIQDNRVVIEGSASASILASDENGLPFVMNTDIPLRGSLEFELPPNSSAGSGKTIPCCSSPLTVQLKEELRNFWFSELNSSQIEVNLSLGITAWVNGMADFITMANLRFAESEDSSERISMALYTVGKGDTLWDIARKYRTDTALLAELNQIDEHMPLPEGLKLFISSC